MAATQLVIRFDALNSRQSVELTVRGPHGRKRVVISSGNPRRRKSTVGHEIYNLQVTQGEIYMMHVVLHVPQKFGVQEGLGTFNAKRTICSKHQTHATHTGHRNLY